MFTLPLRRSAAIVAATSVALLGLTACSTGSSDSDDSDRDSVANTEVDADAFPVTIESAYGEATIESEPERIVTLGVDGEVVVALGVAPYAIQKMTWGGNAEGRTDWFDDAFAELDDAEEPRLIDTSDAVPTQDIIGMEPDVVIATNSGLTQDDFDTLTDAGIPVVAHPGVQWTTTWEQSVELTAQALGRTSVGEDVIADTKEKIQEAAEANPDVVGASFIWAYLTPTDLSQVGIYTSGDNRPAILEEAGLVSPPVVADQSEGSFYFDYALENASDLEADVLITYAENAEQAEQIAADPLVSQIPAVANGSYVVTLEENDTLGLSFPSPLGIPYALDKLLPKVSAALGGEPQIF